MTYISGPFIANIINRVTNATVIQNWIILESSSGNNVTVVFQKKKINGLRLIVVNH